MKNVLFLMAALLLFACSDQKPKAGAPIDGGNGKGIETDTLTSNDGTKAAEGVVSIRKQWISEPDDNGTYLLFDLRDENHLLEAMTYDEAMCKDIGGGAKPGVFYITGDYPNYKVVLEREDVPTQGSVDFLIDEGPLKGEYTSRFQFSDMTDTTITLLFEGEFEHTYMALDKPVKLEPNPEKK